MLNNQITVNHWGHAFDMKQRFCYGSFMWNFWFNIEMFYLDKMHSSTPF